MPIVSGIYGLSEFSDNKLWIVDSPELRLFLKNNYGNPIVEFPGHNYAYIEVDKIKKTWTTTPSFAWLYSNQPPISDISEIIKHLE